uniref:dUTPase-like domain-containing protein n=1 Tax=Panagrolaimus sp. ES5 TaxID=591445 RepID=A0AC34GTX9_9BILA
MHDKKEESKNNIDFGYYGRAASLNKLASEHSIVNYDGVIDEYGELRVLLFNFSDTPFEVKKGDGIVQILCEKVAKCIYEEVQELSETTRGEGGFGSTGTSDKIDAASGDATTIVEKAVSFEKIVEDAQEPEYGTPFAAGADVYSRIETTIPAGGKALISTGIKLSVKPGHYARIAPSSGLAVKNFTDIGAGVEVGGGDEELKVLLFNYGDTDFRVMKGDRIAQIVAERIANIEIKEVKKLSETTRGEAAPIFMSYKSKNNRDSGERSGIGMPGGSPSASIKHVHNGERDNHGSVSDAISKAPVAASVNEENNKMVEPRELIVYCQFLPEKPLLQFTAINTFTNETVSTSTVLCDSDDSSRVIQFFLKYADDIISPRHVQAMIFIGNCDSFKSFPDEYFFRQQFHQYCKKNQIFCSFTVDDTMFMFDALCKTKTLLQEGEEVMFLRQREVYTVEAYVLVREKNCYKFVKHIDPKKYRYNAELKRKLFESSEPKKIILFGESKMFVKMFVKAMKQIFAGVDLDVYDCYMPVKEINETVIRKVWHDMGEKVCPYNIQIGLNNYFLFNSQTFIMDLGMDRVLPLEESFILPVDPDKTVDLSIDRPYYYSMMESIPLAPFNCKNVKVTLKIDENSFYDFKVEPYNEPVDLEPPQLEMIPEPSGAKARVVFDQQNFYVYIFEIGEEVRLVKNRNKTPLYISFTEAMPLVGYRAMEMLKIKPECVVYDFIKICSLSSSEALNLKNEWKFSLFEKDKTLMALLQLFNGTQGYGSMEFLLAYILKQALQIIKYDMAEIFKELEISFKNFSPNENLKNYFIGAAKLLKISITFC